MKTSFAVIIVAAAISGCSMTVGGGKNASDQVVTLEPFTVELPSSPDFKAHWLARYGLESFEAEPENRFIEHVRFLWVRSFHPAALIEIQVTGMNEALFEAKVWNRERGAWELRRSRIIKGEVKRSMWDSLHQKGFVDLPFYDGRSGLDGSDWFIEIRHGASYHAVYRWSPQSGIVYDFGRGLIEGAIESDFVPIY